MFSSEKEKSEKLPSPLIIPVDDTPRPDVFPSVDCSPADSEVEVVHVRGVKKGRRRGRPRGNTNSDSSDVPSERRSSPESGYRSVPECVSSTPVTSSDVSNDSLASISSCPVTSPPPSGPCPTFTGHTSNMPIRVSLEFTTEAPSIITRTAAEDELIRSILEDHCKSFCPPPAVSHDTSLTPLPVDDSKCVSANVDVATSDVVCETDPSADQCTSIEEKTDEMPDVTKLAEEENEELGELEKGLSVDSSKPSVTEDEVSIYDDGGLAAQRASVHDMTTESMAGFSSLDAEQQSSCVELVNQPLLADTDSVMSDTQMSRTSSVSSALSLESQPHCAEVRYKLSQKLVIIKSRVAKPLFGNLSIQYF